MCKIATFPIIGSSVPNYRCSDFIPKEEVYNQYYDSAGNYHYTGTISGKHIIRKDNNNEKTN